MSSSEILKNDFRANSQKSGMWTRNRHFIASEGGLDSVAQASWDMWAGWSRLGQQDALRRY